MVSVVHVSIPLCRAALVLVQSRQITVFNEIYGFAKWYVYNKTRESRELKVFAKSDYN